MTRKFPIILIFATSLLLGCRCERHVSSSLDRTGSEVVGLRSRGFSFLRDTLAERQTIRIEYWYPYELGPGYNISDCRQADTTTLAANGSRPSGTGGGVPAIKSLEITTERNGGKSELTASDSSFVSQTSTTEAQQEETSSEARQDNGAWATVLSIVAVAALAYFVIKKIMS